MTGTSIWNLPIGVANQIYNIANVMLIFGATFTVIATIALFWTGGIREKATAEQIAVLNASARQFESETEKAKQKIAELNLQIAQINLPRKISTSLEKELTNIATKYPSIKFDAAFNDGDGESEAFLIQLENVLRAAGWDPEGWSGNTMAIDFPDRPSVGQVATDGVVFYYHANSALRLAPIAEKLADALKVEGIAATWQEGDWKPLNQGGSDLRTEVLHVIVGKKVAFQN